MSNVLRRLLWLSLLVFGKMLITTVYYITGWKSSFDQASGSSFGERLQNAAMTWMGFEYLSETDITVLMVLLGFYAFCIGFFSDLALGSKAFGPKWNGTIGLVGACGTLVFHARLMAGRTSADQAGTVIILCVLVSVGLLAGLGILKILLLNFADLWMSGARSNSTIADGPTVASGRFDAIANRDRR